MHICYFIAVKYILTYKDLLQLHSLSRKPVSLKDAAKNNAKVFTLRLIDCDCKKC